MDPIIKISVTLSLVMQCFTLRFPVYQYNSSFVIDPPGPPSCTNQKDHVKTLSLHTSLWFIDIGKSTTWGLLVWTEFYQTSCTVNFWGSESRLILQNHLVSTVFPEFHVLESLLNSIKENEIIPLSLFAEYQCSWLTTQIKESTITFIKKVPIYYTSSGTLYSNSFEWNVKLNNNTYQNDNYYLYGHFIENNCPLLIKQTYPSIIRVHENFYYVTIPALQIQFNVLANQTNLYCTVNSDKIFMTPDNYLISVPDINVTYIKMALGPINTDYKWSKLLFDLNHVEEMIEEELQYLEHEICFNRKLIWSSMFFSKNPTIMAKYFTGNSWATGQFLDDGKILVSLPSIADQKCSIPKLKRIINETMKVTCQNLGDVYINPWTNSINGELIQDMGYWLFISEGTYINYQTGKVQITSKFNDLGSWQYKSFNVHEFTKYLQVQPGDKSLHKIVHISESTIYKPFTWKTITSWITDIQSRIFWLFIIILLIFYLIKFIYNRCIRTTYSKTRY